MTYRTGRRSRLGDLIVMHGPYVSGALVPNPVMRFIESDELNALRDELAELRDIDTGCECLHAPVDGCTRVGMHNCAGTWSDHGHPGGRPGPPSMGADPSRQADPNCAYPDGVCGCGEPEGHTPDVDHTRGAAEALAAIQRLLDRAYPHLTETTAWAVRTAAAELGVDGDAPSGPLSAPVSDLPPPLVAQSGVADPNAAETAYPVRRCGDSSAHGPHVVDHGPDQPRNCPGLGPQEPEWHHGCTGCWRTVWHGAVT